MREIKSFIGQLMNILHVIMLYHEIKANPTSASIKRMLFFAGKAAPGYTIAKHIIRLICAVARHINADRDVNSFLRVAFIENYNVSLAGELIPATDLSEQISTAGREASGTGNMKLALNGALTIGTEDGANIEMRQAVGEAWWPFSFGRSAKENSDPSSSYNPWDVYMHNLEIRQAVDTLRDHTFAQNEEEHQAFLALYRNLLEPEASKPLDPFFVLADLQSYYTTQKKVEALFLNPNKWAEYVMHNIAGMGLFSSDDSIHKYAKEVWKIEPCPVGKEEIDHVRADYSEHDQ